MKPVMQAKKTAKNLVFLLTALPAFASAPAHAGIIWSTFIGGSGDDRVTAITTHPSGDILLTGVTFSSDFPATAGVFDKTLAPGGALANLPGINFDVAPLAPAMTTQDVFVTRLSADGTTIVFSTLLGGSWNELPNDIVYDNIADSFLSGGFSSSASASGASAGSATPAVSSTTAGGSGGFGGGGPGGVTSGGSAGAGLPGGSGSGKHLYVYPIPPDEKKEPVTDTIKLAGKERITIAGMTSSTDFPITPGAMDDKFEVSSATTDAEKNGKSWAFPEGFITSLDGTLGTLVYSTYLGGNRYDSVQALAVSANHDILAVGITSHLGTNYPITAQTFVNQSQLQPCQQEDCRSKGFIARLSPSGKLLYGSMVGGAVNDVAMIGDDAVLVGENMHWLGQNNSLPTKGPFGQVLYSAGLHGFVMRITPSNTVPVQNQLKFSGFIGPNPALSILVTKTPEKDLIVAGYAHDILISPTQTLTTFGAFDQTYNGSGSAYWPYIYSSLYMYKKSGNLFQLADAIVHNCTYEPNTDIYVLKMKSDGSLANPIVYSTLLGGGTAGGGREAILPGRGLALDADGRVIIGGYTNSYNFPVTPGAIDASPIKPFFADTAAPDYKILKHTLPFVSVLDMKSHGKKDLVYSTFLGNKFGYVADVAVAKNGNIIAAGRTEDDQFPTTPGVIKSAKSDLTDGFVTVFDTTLLPNAKYGMYTDTTGADAYYYGDHHAYGPYTVQLDMGNTAPFVGNTSFKLKLSGPATLQNKAVRLYISPDPLLPGEKNANTFNNWGGVYSFVDLISQPNMVLKTDTFIGNNGAVDFSIPITTGAKTVGTVGVPFYAQAFITEAPGKYIATNAIKITPQ